MYRTWVITRHTLLEAIVQPIYSLLLVLCAAILAIFALLPFFTLGEDAVMFKSVGLDVILLFVLIATLFASSKSIYEEIEDRTMLTLMSKPVRKGEVLVGKYLGIILSAALAIAILGLVLILCAWYRIPGDYLIRTTSIDDREVRRAFDYRIMHVMGLLPSLLLMWMQIATLAAVSVAVSTRLSLVVNLPLVILLYVAGNLTRFLFPLDGTESTLHRAVAWVLASVLPYLELFDLRAKTVYGILQVPGTQFANDPAGIPLATVWGYLLPAGLYALCFSALALSAGLLSFQSRELGGAEG